MWTTGWTLRPLALVIAACSRAPHALHVQDLGRRTLAAYRDAKHKTSAGFRFRKEGVFSCKSIVRRRTGGVLFRVRLPILKMGRPEGAFQGPSDDPEAPPMTASRNAYPQNPQKDHAKHGVGFTFLRIVHRCASCCA